ncbi:MAG: redoxin domain-containing protein [Pyrinomonadaceae bacterium]
MKGIFVIILLALSFLHVSAQNEQSPVVEKTFDYKDWTYKNIRADGSTNLREFTKGKKLVMVVYFAPWCPNWKHDAAYVQGMYEKYKASGLEVIGVGEYDPVSTMKTHLDAYKVTFPAVYESDNSGSREKTVHFTQRREAGDTRKWGSPWYVFMEPSALEAKGDAIAKKVNVVNGELIRDDAEKFIRAKLGLSADAGKAAVVAKKQI